MTYDPTEDPRWLGQEPEDIDPLIIERLAELPRVQEVVDMFASEAWAELDKILEQRFDQALVAAFNAKSQLSLADYRGQARVYQFMRMLPYAMRNTQSELIELQRKVLAEDEEEG